MPFTFKDLKDTIRPMVWPAGEARSRRVAHDKWFLDALIEIQRHVECFQQNNVDLIPHCATTFNCGLTSFDFARAQIKRLSVVDAPVKKLEDITQPVTVLFAATESLPSDSWLGYPNTINNGINNAFAPVSVAPNVRYEYPVATTVTGYTIDVVALGGASAVLFVLQGSNDGATWTDVDSRTLDFTADAPRDTVTVEVTNTTAYFQYRLLVGTVGVGFTTVGGMFFYSLSFTGYSTADLAGAIDWCTEIPYEQVEHCHVRDYLGASARAGCCLPIHHFFGLPQSCVSGKGTVPIPTDAGLPPGLPVLPLGYKYPQTSTDFSRRAWNGRWSNDRGRVYIAPWIQSSETVVLKWDGIKREYSDGDLIENDTTLINCVLLYVIAQHEKYDNRDANQAAIAERDFNLALQGLWKDCREETRIRGCEGSNARGGAGGAGSLTLYYNDARSYTATCPPGKNGVSRTVTIPAGTVSSTVSKADANTRAYAEAQSQANAMLSCVDAPITYHNEAVTGHASCVQETGAPMPDGSPVIVNIPANQPQYDSTTSQAAATALAQSAADEQAQAGLSCTFWNREQEYTSECETGTGPDVTKTVAAHTFSSTLSQADADQKAINEAKKLADEALVCDGDSVVVYNTEQGPFTAVRRCFGLRLVSPTVSQPCQFNVSVTVTILAGRFTGQTQAAANQAALNYMNSFVNAQLTSMCNANMALCADASASFTI